VELLNIRTEWTQAHFYVLGYTFLLSFFLATMIAIVYEITFQGLSYSKNYIQSLVLSAIVAATILQAIGDSMAMGIGIIAALTIIRFRTNFKDPRDIIFMFAALASGIATGVNAYKIAITGTFSFCLAAWILNFFQFGQKNHFDGMLRFNIANAPHAEHQLEQILKTFCKNFSLISLRDIAQNKRLDYAYHVKLRKKYHHSDFIKELRNIESIEGVNLFLQESTVDL